MKRSDTKPVGTGVGCGYECHNARQSERLSLHALRPTVGHSAFSIQHFAFLCLPRSNMRM
jgi:hypothetical protein